MLNDLFTFAIQNGLPQDTLLLNNSLLLLLLLPAVATLVIFFRVVIGLEYLQLSRAIFLSMGFAALGLGLGLFFFLLSIGLDLLIKFAFDRVKLLPQAKYSIVLFFTLLLLLSFFITAGYVTKDGFASLDIVSVLLIVVSAQGMLQIGPGDSRLHPFAWLVEMILFLYMSFFLLASPALQKIVLESPILYLGSLVVLMLLLGRFKGLRLNELFRFFHVISNKEP